MTRCRHVASLVHQTRPRGTDVAGAVVGSGVPHDAIDALRCVVVIRRLPIGGKGLGANDRLGTGLDDAKAGAHVADHRVGGPAFGDALGDDFGGRGGKGLAVLTQVALGSTRGGHDGVEGDGNVQPIALGGHLRCEIGSDGDAVLGGRRQEATQQSVVGVDSVGPVGGDQLPELLEQGEVALSGVDRSSLDLKADAAHQAVEGLVEDTVQESEGVVLGGAEDGVVVLKKVQRVSLLAL